MVRARAFRIVPLDLHLTISELIDARSFSSMWYWIVLAAFWSMLSHYIVGVPFDLVQRAQRRNDPETWRDLTAISRIQARRYLAFSGRTGLVATALGGFLITALFLLGFFYWIELCQALFFLVFPFCLLTLLSQRTAQEILDKQPEGPDLVAGLKRHRLCTQLVGIVSIFITAFWGIWQTMSVGVLGN